MREHLFFASLFQPLRPNAPSQNAETRCQVRVPPDATLAVQIGYKHPIGIEPGASLSGEILAVVAGGPPERLLGETWPVRSMSVDGVRFPPTHRVDVSHLGGKDVTLVFRTQRQGRVRLSPFTLETYGMFWQNPVLEQP